MKQQILRLSSLVLVLMLLGSSQVKTTASQLPPTAQGDQTDSIVYTFTIPELQFTQDSDGNPQPSLEEYEASGAPGDPLLPIKAYNIALPPDVIPESVKAEVIASQSIDLNGEYQIEAAPPHTTWVENQEITLWGKNADSIIDGKNTQVYQNDAYFPQSLLSSSSFDQMRKWRFVTLMLTPLQFNPVTGKLRLTTEVQVQVTFDRAIKVDSNQLQIELSDTVMDDRAIQLFYNFDEAQNWYPETSRPAGLSNTYNYVIITSNKVVAASQKLTNFVAHKEAQGYSVLVVTENQYGGITGVYPNLLAQKIRQWLIDNYYSLGIEYVLLIGNPTPYNPDKPTAAVGDVPMRMCWPGYYTYRDGNQLGENVPTDFLYAELTGNWDLNANHPNDNRCGEIGDDDGGGGMNFVPEVYVGRIPVYYSTGWAGELDNILTKTMVYEDSGDLTWRKRALLPMSFLGKSGDGGYLGEAMKNDYLDALGYDSHTLYMHKGSGCYSSFSSDQDLVDNAVRDHWKNRDYGIVSWLAHGWSGGAAIGYEGCEGGTLLETMDTGYLDLGDDHPAIVFQSSCSNGYPESENNLGYRLLVYGAVATISASRGSTWTSFESPSRATAMNADTSYYVTERIANGETVGHAWQDEILQMSQASNWREDPDKPNQWLVYNLYGDPSLSINDGHPSTPTLPTDLTATALSSNKIKLHWTDTSDNELGFVIDRTTNPGIAWMQVSTAKINGSAWENQGLSCGSHYYYRIHSYNAYGGSGFSNIADVVLETADTFEDDNTYTNAKSIIPAGAGSSGQTHTFSHPGDVDWVKFSATWGKTYNITTTSLGSNSDTTLELYDLTGQGLLATTDNCNSGTSASCINNWVAPPGGTFYIKISNKNNGGGCTGYNYSLAVQETGAANWPAQPTNLSATTASHCQIDLSWISNSVNEQGFEIERWGWHGVGWGLIGWYNVGTVGAGVTHYSDTGLDCNKTYQYRVRAYNANGKSFYSDSDDATTFPADDYEADNTYSAAKAITVNGTAQVRNFDTAGDQDWAKFAAVAGQVYTITTSSLGESNDTVLELYNKNGTTQLEWNDDCGSTPSCIKKWVAPSTGTYYLLVSNYYGEGGCPGYQYTLSVTGAANTTSLVGPSILSISDRTVGSITLLWSDPASTAHNFHVERWQPITGTIGTWRQAGISGPGLIFKTNAEITGVTSPNDGQANFVDTGLACNTTYQYRVSAFDSLGDTAYSEIINATTLLTDTYEPDDSYSQSHIIAVNSNPQYHNLSFGLDYDWIKFTAVAGEVYTVTTSQFTHSDSYTPTMELYADPPNTPITSTQQCGDDLRTLCITGWQAPDNADYYIRIYGQGGCPGHDYSLTVQDTINNDSLPSAPTDFAGVVAAADKINLTWTYTPTDASGFRIEQLMGNAWMQVANLQSKVTQFLATNLACGVPYKYRIYAFNEHGKSPYVTLDEITMPACVYPEESPYLPMYLPNIIR